MRAPHGLSYHLIYVPWVIRCHVVYTERLNYRTTPYISIFYFALPRERKPRADKVICVENGDKYTSQEQGCGSGSLEICPTNSEPDHDNMFTVRIRSQSMIGAGLNL